MDEVVPLLQARGLFRRDYPGTTLRESLDLALPANQFQNNKENHAMQKTTLLLAVALAFSASSWGQDVKINGTGVSRGQQTPIHTAKIRRPLPCCRKICIWRCREIHRRGGGPELSAADGLCR